MVKVVISGCRGRMGLRIAALAAQDKDVEIAATFDIGDNAGEAIGSGDVVIEFTAPEATLDHLGIALRQKKAMVIGTTAIDGEGVKRINEAAKKIPIVFSPNMSVGVNVLFELTRKSAGVLKDYKVSMSEAHHKHKKDAPSGTARKLAQIVKDVRGKNDIPIESIREGEIIGDHTVVYDGEFERVTLTHHAKSRDVFASGALVAAKFVAKKKKGLFSMQDVLGI